MEIEQRIKTVLEEQVRPFLKSHGGDVTLVDYQSGVLTVELLGSCVGCPSADLSTKAFIEDAVGRAVPEVRAVELFLSISPDILDFLRSVEVPEG